VSKTSFSELLGSLDPDPHIRGKQFERLTKWWLTNTPVMPFAPLTITKLWLWDEWPDRPGPDIGIDLVVELSDGSLGAVQAKCFDESADIPKSQLDSFISAASPKVYAHRLLIATTDGLSANARRMLRDQQVICVMRSELEASLTAWPASINDLATPLTQTKWQPLPHQKEAIDNVTKGLATGDRGQMIMACGTGKTLTALWVAEALNPTITLVLVPSLNLLSQTLNEWARHTNIPWTYICVCSDDTVNKTNDEPIATIADFPFEVTTESNRIANFLETPGRKIIFSTYQSSAQIARALQATPTVIDLAICDEAHRLTGKTDAGYATILDNTKIPVAKRLFMTATPRTYTPIVRKKAEERGVEVTSMDDENVYGPVLHKLSFGDAINRGLLSDYKVVIVGVTDPQVQDLIDRRELVTVNKDVDTDARTLAAHIGLAKATKDYNLSRIISFHSRINTAAKFAQDHPKILDWLPDAYRPNGTTWTDTISGAMNTGQRRRLLSQLRIDQPDRHALLTNARCLTEGVDVPTLDGVAFIDPRSSQVDIIQAVGRAIRKSDNKESGFIVLPVLIPTNAEVEHVLEDTAFKPIWAILNALKAHDSELTADLSALRVELGRDGVAGAFPKRIHFDLPADIDSLLPGFSTKLSIALIEQSTSQWEFWLGLLIRYVSENENSFVPHDYCDGKFRLGQWVNSQRTLFKNGELEQARIDKLNSVDGWVWNQLDEVWNTFFQLLSAYAQEFGHAAVQSEPALYREQKLIAWVRFQRQRYRNGLLESERVQQLESLPGWTWTPKEDSWDQWFELLESYASTVGHSRVPQGFMVASQNLGRWVSKQRSRFRKGTLETERVTRLESLPEWTWNPHDAIWESSFAALIEFIENSGNAAPPQSHKVGDIALGTWVSKQRSDYKKGRLTEEDVARLESLPGWTWDTWDSSWDLYFSALTQYTNKFGQAAPPKTLEIDGIQLGAWASSQRARYNKGALEQKRISQLESLPGWTWNPSSEAWEKYFRALNEYVTEFGTATPPQSFIASNLKLGTWVNEQRQKFKKGRLEEAKAERLVSLTGWTWDPSSEAWETMYLQLREFAAKHNHVKVTNEQTDKKTQELSQWIKRQRSSYKYGSLDQEKITKLESLPGWSWSPHTESWDFLFELLKDFSIEHRHARIGRESLYKGHDLASWVQSQRGRFKSGKLEEDRIKKLESINGWSWDTLQDSWDKFFGLLQDFVDDHGHALVPQGTASTPYKGENLARWVNKQRSKYNKGILEAERIEKLESVAGWVWNISEESWEKYFHLLQEFVKETGHSRVPRHLKLYKGLGLSSWVQSQRTNYQRKKLGQHRIIRLEALPGWAWIPHASLWDELYAALERYTVENKVATPPRSCVMDGLKLGVWVGTQRQKYKQGILKQEQIHRLEALNGWAWELKSGPRSSSSGMI
jgi:superfamily II DNA or RNA helicase